MKRALFIISIVTAGLNAWSATAAPCRMAEASIRGSQAGYERDIAAAIETAEKDLSASDILGKCVGGMTAVVNSPTFPSLSGLFDRVFDRICKAARDEVRGVVGNANAQVRDMTSGLDINGTANDIGIGNVDPGIDIYHNSGAGVNVDTRDEKASWLDLF